MAKKIEVPENTKDLPAAIIKQMLSLATSGFGLVAALAWNDVVKETLNSYVKPHLPEGSKIISSLIYALIVTILAVVVTLQLTKLQTKFSNKNSQTNDNS